MMTIDCLAHSQIIKIKKVRETGTGGFGGGVEVQNRCRIYCLCSFVVTILMSHFSVLIALNARTHEFTYVHIRAHTQK